MRRVQHGAKSPQERDDCNAMQQRETDRIGMAMGRESDSQDRTEIGYGTGNH